jgi:hypothetical protein
MNGNLGDFLEGIGQSRWDSIASPVLPMKSATPRERTIIYQP